MAILTKRDRTRHKLFLKMMVEKRTVDREEVTRINSIYSVVFGRAPHKPYTSCGSCIKKRIMDVLNQVLTPEEIKEAKDKRAVIRMKLNELKLKRKK